MMNEENNILKLTQIKRSEFDLISKFVYETIGINLTEQKINLVTGRLQKLLKKYNLSTFQDYYNLLLSDKTGSMISELSDQISTNHTFYWREHEHFDFFKDRAIPEIVNKKLNSNNKDLRIWCAGCSTGEEPYTLEFLLYETLGLSYKEWQAGILATDISSRALEFAENGIYSSDRLRLLPKNYLNRFFNKIDSENYKIKDSIKEEVTFRRFNLMNENFPFKKKFDIIFCRNVMIYFDELTKKALVNKFADCLNDKGYLFIGHSESIKSNKDRFDYVQPALYQKR